MLTSLKKEGFSHDLISDYVTYLSKQGKSYRDRDELIQRAYIFAEKDAKIQEWNLSENGKQMQLGHNRFSDWTQEELNSIMTYDRANRAPSSQFAPTRDADAYGDDPSSDTTDD